MKLKVNPSGIVMGLAIGLAVALPVAIFAAPQATIIPTPDPSSTTSNLLDESNQTESTESPSEESSEPSSSGSQSSEPSSPSPGSSSSNSQPPPNFVAQTTPQSATAPNAPSGTVTSLQYFYVTGTGSAYCGGRIYISGKVLIPSAPDWRGLRTDVYSATYLQESNGGRSTNGKKDIWTRDSVGSDWQLAVSGSWTPTVEVRCAQQVTTQVTPTPTSSPSPTVRYYSFSERGVGPIYCSTFRADSTLLTGRIVFPRSVTWEGLEVEVLTATFVALNNGGTHEGGARETWTRPNENSQWTLTRSESWTPEVEITCEYRQ